MDKKLTVFILSVFLFLFLAKVSNSQTYTGAFEYMIRPHMIECEEAITYVSGAISGLEDTPGMMLVVVIVKKDLQKLLYLYYSALLQYWLDGCSIANLGNIERPYELYYSQLVKETLDSIKLAVNDSGMPDDMAGYLSNKVKGFEESIPLINEFIHYKTN